MRLRLSTLLLVLSFCWFSTALAQHPAAVNVIYVTLDGMRCRRLFTALRSNSWGKAPVELGGGAFRLARPLAAHLGGDERSDEAHYVRRLVY